MNHPSTPQLIAIGVSAGGVHALSEILPMFPADFSTPVVVVMHAANNSENSLADYLNNISHLDVLEAEDKHPILGGHAYIAPGGYHLLVEQDKSFALSVDDKVNYARPSIDIFFASAVDAYQDRLIGVILTGANHDGAQGLKRIHEAGGVTVVENPNTAHMNSMPLEAIKATKVDYVLNLREIVPFLVEHCSRTKIETHYGSHGNQ